MAVGALPRKHHGHCHNSDNEEAFSVGDAGMPTQSVRNPGAKRRLSPTEGKKLVLQAFAANSLGSPSFPPARTLKTDVIAAPTSESTSHTCWKCGVSSRLGSKPSSWRSVGSISHLRYFVDTQAATNMSYNHQGPPPAAEFFYFLSAVGSMIVLLMRCYLYSQHGGADESFDAFIVRLEATEAFLTSMRDDPEYRARVEAARRAKAAAEARLILAARARGRAWARAEEAMEALRSISSSSEPAAPPVSRGDSSSSSGNIGNGSSSAPPADEVVEAARARLRAEVTASTEMVVEVGRARQALVAAQVSMKDVFLAGLQPRRARAARSAAAAASTGGLEGDEEMQPMMGISQVDSLEAGRLAQ